MERERLRTTFRSRFGRRLGHVLADAVYLSPALVIAAIVGIAVHAGAAGGIEGRSLDAQFALLRALKPAHVDPGVTVVAMDETHVSKSGSPQGGWYQHLAKLLDRVRIARPRLIALDIALPDLSGERQSLNADPDLMRSLFELRRDRIPVVLSVVFDENRKPRREYAPYMGLVDPIYGAGSAIILVDDDHIVRRHTEAIGGKDAVIPTLVGQIVRAVGQTYRSGLMNYRVQNTIPIIPAHYLENVGDPGPPQQQLSGQIVIIGVTQDAGDRLPQPVSLSSLYPADSQPGVLLQANFVAGILTSTLIATAPHKMTYALIAVSLLGWFFPMTRWWPLAWGIGLPLVAGLVSMAALNAGYYVPMTAATISTVLIAIARRLSIPNASTAL